ncbi:hypothetical protein PR202_ga17010 [Eleusine coracana subsp. coracana]|uniref:Uncharacterized protein n=1 Tax=Eleusine coracana subsp. coracana TaxID=191504 RepID=A0AAV5CPF6_ELECO|nr:hypothetical protein PR202_ga17010 [Eleusine coracana subsp. coracana]
MGWIMRPFTQTYVKTSPTCYLSKKPRLAFKYPPRSRSDSRHAHQHRRTRYTSTQPLLSPSLSSSRPRYLLLQAPHRVRGVGLHLHLLQVRSGKRVPLSFLLPLPAVRIIPLPPLLNYRACSSIRAVISQGINAGDVKKLQDAGIYTCNGLMMHTKKSLTGIKGLSEAKVEKICEAAEKLLSQGFMTGSDLLIKRKSVVRITTGSQALDDLLGGGIETLCITEAFGEFRSGKTQLAHTLCVSTQIIYARAYTYEHQYNLLLGLAAKMAEEPFRLLIVDSVIALFRVDFSGRGELAERQQKLAQMLSRLTKIAEEFNVAVYITNQVIADPGGGMFITDPKKPAGGHVLAHAATIRLMLRKGKGEQRVCKIFDAPNLPEGEAISFCL